MPRKSLVTKKEVETWLRAFPQYRDRALMYEATLSYINRTYPTANGSLYVQLCVIVHRRLQDILPLDAKGVQLEKDWRSAEGMKSLVEFAEEVLNGRRVIERNGVRYYLPVKKY